MSRGPDDRLTQMGIGRSRLGFRDLLRESAVTVGRRPLRTLLTGTGTILGVGAVVTTLGLSSTAAHQVSSTFDVIRATEVVVEDARPDQSDPAFPDNVDTRLARLDGVRAAGVIWTLAERSVSTNPRWDPTSPSGAPVSIVAASPGALRALHPRVSAGRLYDSFHQERAERVALLGAAAAQRLGITRVDDAPAVFVGDTALTVIGIIEDVDRYAQALRAVIVPTTTARRLAGSGERVEPQVLIDTAPGAAALIARQAPYALRPQDPARLNALAPPDPDVLRGRIEEDVNTLFLLLAGVSLAIGAVSIANTTLVALLERVPEIGLRRALGARPRHIAGHLLAEATATGTAGGIAGASVGIVLTVTVAAAKDWTPVLDPRLPLAAPFLGSLAGLAAGLYPAWRATRVQPVEALRR